MNLTSLLTPLLMFAVLMTQLIPATPLVVAAAAVVAPRAQPTTTTQFSGNNDNDKAKNDGEEKGLQFRLSAGVEQVATPPASNANSLVKARRLSEAETDKLLARLPLIKPEADETTNFNFRERSQPPPRAGDTITAALFAAVPTSNGVAPTATNANAALRVLRFAPEGAVKLAPALSVTFSQPMVAVAAQEEAAGVVPVKLSPQPAGSWRWLGTQTLTFEPDDGRLPMATNYTVTIPAGTTSAQGNRLAETKIFNFATPAPTIVNSYPNGEAQPRDQLMFIEFDQAIDATKVLANLKLQNTVVVAPPPNLNVRLRLATPEEIAGNKEISELVKNARSNRWLAFRAVNADNADNADNETSDVLPSAARVKVIVSKGTPSQEGARTTDAEQSFAFKTYGALQVSETACGYAKRCSPFDSFRIEFSNQLDTESFKPEQVTISPALEGAKISAAYNSITIEAAKRSNTIYTVTLDRAIKDSFGQTLTGNRRATFKVTTAAPTLFSTAQNFTVLDPAGRKSFSVYSVNQRKLKVRLYKVAPEDWYTFRNQEFLHSRAIKTVSTPGKLVSDKIINTNARIDELTETVIDLSPALNEGYGQVIVKVEFVEDQKDKDVPMNVYAYRANKVAAWVQATNIGLDAFADKTELVAWANSLKDGAPLGGVEVEIAPNNLTESVKATTAADGLARLELRDESAQEIIAKKAATESGLLIARRGNDVAVLPESFYDDSHTNWQRTKHYDDLSWYVFDDRKLYRPGETVNVKGWLRTIGWRRDGDVNSFNAFGKIVKYILKDSQNNEIAKGTLKLNPFAGFDLKLSLPANMNLGNAVLELECPDTDFTNEKYTHTFQVQEFRRPDFEVTAQASEAPHFVGSSATATMSASYFAGGGLANTEVAWNVRAKPTNYTPPNRSDFTFGKFTAWWRANDEETDETTEHDFTARTDANGKQTLRMDFERVSPARPSSVTAEAKIQDVNRQTFAAAVNLSTLR